MILFIHGFGSCGWGEKSLSLRRFFGVAGVIAPDLPFRPRAALAHLEGILARYPVTALVGSSLGGFFATWLNRARHLPAVLINPVVRPHELLSGHLGPQQRWCDGHRFDVDSGYLDELAAMQPPAPGPGEPYLVLLQTGDEVLDYRAAADFYRAGDVRVQAGGSHRFDDFHHQLAAIHDWLAVKTTDGKDRQAAP